MGFKKAGIQPWLRLYVVLSLGAAAVFSTPTLSAIPLLLLALFLSFRLRPTRPVANFSLDLYLFLALPLFYESIVGLEASPLLSLPLLGLLGSDLEQLAASHRFHDSWFKRRPSNLAVGLAVVIVVSFAVAALLNKVNLVLTCALLSGYLLFLAARVLVAVPLVPVETGKAQHRVVAGHSLSFTAPLVSKSGLVGWLYLASPYEWLKLKPARSRLSRGKLDLDVSVTPPLAGPSSLCLPCLVLDRWGLIQQKFQLELAELYVIPRARYATWLARRYLETTRPGAITPQALGLATFRPSVGSRRGIEYYGNRLYQPGDSLRSIDWKHSVKFNELVVKEFDDPQASSAALLVNLAVENAEEADRLIYTWITTSITLAREGIPTLLAVYNHDAVLVKTDFLNPRQALLRSLALSREVVVWSRPQKYLQAPDPIRLKANIGRLQMAGQGPTAKLIELLELEFKALGSYAASNPATKALGQVLTQAGSRSTVLFISARNHDVEALEMAKYNLTARNHSFTEISLNGSAPHPRTVQRTVPQAVSA
ncbi:MAG: DUF58 domain-containing protein [Chloroflexi bacterium]|nr:DUF58 domain-containing protein [Chloroflexota bacterium]